MEIQDCLIRHKWDKEAAMKELDEEYMKLVGRNKSKTNGGSPAANPTSHNVSFERELSSCRGIGISWTVIIECYT